MCHDVSGGTKLELMPNGGEFRMLKKDDVPDALKHFVIEIGKGKCKAPKVFNHLWIVWYINHSDSPNIELRLPENNYYALRDIKAGEELFTNYNAFEEPSELKEGYYST